MTWHELAKSWHAGTAQAPHSAAPCPRQIILGSYEAVTPERGPTHRQQLLQHRRRRIGITSRCLLRVRLARACAAALPYPPARQQARCAQAGALAREGVGVGTRLVALRAQATWGSDVEWLVREADAVSIARPWGDAPAWPRLIATVQWIGQHVLHVDPGKSWQIQHGANSGRRMDRCCAHGVFKSDD